MKINFAIIGCGRIAKKHLEVYNNNFSKNLNLVAVCDKRRYLAEKLINEKNKKIKIYKNCKEMFKNEKIDLLAILTESGNHFQHANLALDYVNNLIIEKPVTLKISDALKLKNKAKKMNKNIFVVLQNRYNSPIVKLNQLIKKNEIGKIISSSVRVRWKRDQNYYNQAKWRGTWKQDGGALTNQGIHHLDLLTWLLGPVKSVFAYSRKALAKIECEDTLSCLIKFESGAIGTFEVTTAARPKDLEGSISVLGEKGSIEIGGFAANKINYVFLNNRKSKNNLEKYSTNPPNVYGFGHYKFYDEVIKEIFKKENNSIKIEDSLYSLKIVHAIYMSIENKKEIFLNKKISSRKLGV